ncbi:hypothetical protein D3C87_1431320 [compost metagenome]
MHIDRQIDRRQLGQWRLARAQGDQRGTAFAHQVGSDQQILGTPGLGNADRHVGRLECHSRHRLHVRVGIRRSSEQQAEEFVLGVRRDRTRGTKAIELDTLGLGHERHRPLQFQRIELLANLHQRMQGGVENFQAVVGDRIVFVNRKLAKTRTRRQALGQLQLQVLKAGTTDGTAKTHDGRLADAHAVGQVGHGAVHHGRRIKQHVVGDLELRLA